MKQLLRLSLTVFAVLMLVSVVSALAIAEDSATATCDTAATDADVKATETGRAELAPPKLLTPVKGKPGGTACCNPDDEPGVGGNPFCFEGASCCSDGNWNCNNADGSPSCTTGPVCDGPCGSRGDACSSGDDCCSGNCRKNGTCR